MPCVVATYLFLEERAEVAQSPWRTFAPWRKTPEEAETRSAFGAAIMVCLLSLRCCQAKWSSGQIERRRKEKKGGRNFRKNN